MTKAELDIVEFRQTAISEFPPKEEWFEDNINDMDQAEAFGRILIEVGERVQLTLGMLIHHVEKGKAGSGFKGGRRELARRLERPESTLRGWESSVIGKEIIENCAHVRAIPEELPIKHYETIAKSPEPEKTVEFLVETFEETGKLPTIRETKTEVRKQKLDSSDFTPKLYDIWSFGFRDPRYGQEGYKWGLICGQIIENLLYYYTKEDDIVLDPMAGGGTTIDVCKAFNRRCMAFDIDPVRDDILKNDITKGLPDIVKDVQLAILEPPYYNMMQDAYSSLNEFLSFLEDAIKNTADRLRPGGVLALIIMDQVNKDQEKYPMIGPAFELLNRTELEYEHLVGLPLGTQQHTAYHVKWAKEGRFMLGINRQMWIFRRPAT